MMAFFDNLPRWLLILTGLLLVFFIGALDWMTGDYSLLIFYTVPIFFASWFAGRGAGTFVCLAAGASRMVANNPIPGHPAVNVWNTVVDTVFFLVICLLVSQLRKALE